ncbi:MAG: exonuclease domain-containing protein [Oscillospiraceae bacterium]
MSDSLQSLFSRCDSVLVFDTETSGLSWQRDEIIEFSAIRLTASGTEEVDEFIRCTRSLPPRIVELTGITDDLLRERGDRQAGLCRAAGRAPDARHDARGL